MLNFITQHSFIVRFCNITKLYSHLLTVNSFVSVICATPIRAERFLITCVEKIFYFILKAGSYLQCITIIIALWQELKLIHGVADVGSDIC